MEKPAPAGTALAAPANAQDCPSVRLQAHHGLTIDSFFRNCVVFTVTQHITALSAPPPNALPAQVPSLEPL